METHYCAPARGPYAHPKTYDCSHTAVNVPPSLPPPPSALGLLATAGITEARAIVGVIALHATRDPAARRLLAHVAEELATLAAEIDEAVDA